MTKQKTTLKQARTMTRAIFAKQQLKSVTEILDLIEECIEFERDNISHNASEAWQTVRAAIARETLEELKRQINEGVDAQDIHSVRGIIKDRATDKIVRP